MWQWHAVVLDCWHAGQGGRQSTRTVDALASSMASVSTRLLRADARRQGAVPGSAAAVPLLCRSEDRQARDQRPTTLGRRYILYSTVFIIVLYYCIIHCILLYFYCITVSFILLYHGTSIGL